MVHTTQNYSVFGLCPSSGILETRKHNVSETGSGFVCSICSINFYLPSYPSSTNVHALSQFYCIFPVISPRISLISGNQVNAMKSHSGCLMTEVSSFQGTQQCLSPPHLRKGTDPISETLCFLVSRILDDGQNPKTQ
jgi:hypothetical protein